MQLRLSEPSFVDMCRDYAEVLDAIDQLESSSDERSNQKRAELRRQRIDLEEEIVEFMATHS